MKKLFTLSCLLLSLSCTAQNQQRNGWIQMFNGKDLKDWNIKIRGHKLGDNFGNTFRVENGILQVRYDQYKAWNDSYGHMFYKKPFSSYLLIAEYRFVGEQVNGGPAWALRNNGLMLDGQNAESMGLNQDFPISLELQLLGGNGKDPRPTANLCTPGTNVVMNNKLITEHCITSTSKTYHGEQWVRVAALVLRDSVIKHIVFNDTVIVYSKPTVGGGNVADAAPDLLKEGRILSGGTISIQSESAPTDFRKIEIFDLGPYMSDPKKLDAIIHKLQEETRTK